MEGTTLQKPDKFGGTLGESCTHLAQFLKYRSPTTPPHGGQSYCLGRLVTRFIDSMTCGLCVQFTLLFNNIFPFGRS